jgi:hypothetical protein
MSAIVDAVKNALNRATNVQKGDTIRIQIPHYSEPLEVINTIGKPAFYGERLTGFLRNGAAVWSGLNTSLLVMYVAEEIKNVTFPDSYIAYITPSSSTPDVSTQNGGLSFTLDPGSIFNRLQKVKTDLAIEACSLSDWGKQEKSITSTLFGYNPKAILSLISDSKITQTQVCELLSADAPKVEVPVAQSALAFQSPIPLLIDGAQINTTAYFSSFDDGEVERITIWIKQNNGKTIRNVGYFEKQSGSNSPWVYTNTFGGSEITVVFSTSASDPTVGVFSCKAQVSNGLSALQFSCQALNSKLTPIAPSTP